MYESHSCACMCSAMAIFCAGLYNCLYVRVPGGSSLNEMSCAISASVLTLKVPVLLMIIGMILFSSIIVPCVCKACLSGSYML